MWIVIYFVYLEYVYIYIYIRRCYKDVYQKLSHMRDGLTRPLAALLLTFAIPTFLLFLACFRRKAPLFVGTLLFANLYAYKTHSKSHVRFPSGVALLSSSPTFVMGLIHYSTSSKKIMYIVLL